MKRDNIVVNDRQLACARINSEEGQNYLKVNLRSECVKKQLYLLYFLSARNCSNFYITVNSPKFKLLILSFTFFVDSDAIVCVLHKLP